MAYDIFISYRRSGGYETAKHLYDLLTHDGYSVSFDIDTLRNGDFDVELLKRIDECTDFIIVLNKGAFDKCFDSTTDKKHDWLRNELAYALEKKKNIIPIMLEGFTNFPANLPEDIDSVAKKNGPKYDKYYFDDFYRRLKNHFLQTNKKSTRWKYLLIGCICIVLLITFIVSNKNITHTFDDINEEPDIKPSTIVEIQNKNETNFLDAMEEDQKLWKEELPRINEFVKNFLSLRLKKYYEYRGDDVSVYKKYLSNELAILIDKYEHLDWKTIGDIDFPCHSRPIGCNELWLIDDYFPSDTPSVGIDGSDFFKRDEGGLVAAVTTNIYYGTKLVGGKVFWVIKENGDWVIDDFEVGGKSEEVPMKTTKESLRKYFVSH